MFLKCLNIVFIVQTIITRRRLKASLRYMEMKHKLTLLFFYANSCRRCKQNSSWFRFPKKTFFCCWPNTTQWIDIIRKTVDPNRKQSPTSVDVWINSFQLRLNIRHRWCFRNEKSSFFEKHLQVKSIYHFIGFYRFASIEKSLDFMSRRQYKAS